MVKTAPKPTSQTQATIYAEPSAPDVPAFEPSENDIIDDILALVIQMAPGFSAALAHQIAAEAREKWGGDRPYVARKIGQGYSQRNQAIKRDYLAGAHLHLLERRYELKRSRLWEIIKS